LYRERSDDIIKEAAPWQKENAPVGMMAGRSSLAERIIIIDAPPD